MHNVSRIVASGMCTGCSACNICKNITFADGPFGFPNPIIGDNCDDCGKCLTMCIYDPLT